MLYEGQHAERSEKTGVWGRIPRKHDDFLTGPSDLVKAVKELYQRDSAPSEARKRGSGGGSPRKHDDLLSGPSDLLG